MQPPAPGFYPADLQGQKTSTLATGPPRRGINTGTRTQEFLSGEADAAVLRRMLSTKRPVRELTIFCISMAAFKVAFDKLEECLNLKNAYFFDVDFEGEDIGTTLSVAFQSLHTLELRCINTGPGFAKDVADYIRQNKSLKDLQLLDSCGGDEGAAVLIKALAVNDTLKRFSLLRMRLSSGLLIVIAEMLATNSMLEAVNITSVCPCGKGQGVLAVGTTLVRPRIQKAGHHLA
ncbi:hypothetical protein HPB51_012430 [Rhipicephalus microplus]|uniref:Uncharacterized protein n=1 Tax=Rhipicephalus microplus TaxID=6941 RepID=A0A9J6E9E8_RHIMP|nr:hypothetical protein HPB51_012430 [Rhipicephalus microplus]